MRRRNLLVWASLFLLSGAAVQADITAHSGFCAGNAGFSFAGVPSPASNDAATDARFSLVSGVRDSNGGALDVLHDGRVPSGEDQPSKNFFFRAGTDGGRLLVDLGRTVAAKRICTYSWHSGTRAPQVYAAYAASGDEAGFAQEPKRGVEPTACGWRFVTRVDTRPATGDGGGQYGVVIAAPDGEIGSLRYLLFDIEPTESRDPFGNTFYSEIDVIDAKGPVPVSGVTALRPIQKSFEAESGSFRFIVEATDAPDLADWVEAELKPLVQAWYPKLVALLSSDGYQAPSDILLRLRDDMGGTPASASGAGIHLNAVWIRRERKREALGCVVHEMVHVVQNYGYARHATSNGSPAPGWVVEGLADYIRWFLYEPQSRGAEITKHTLAAARYDGSYRVTGNFFNWVTQTYDKNLVRKLNAAAREDRYAESLWNEWTGKSLQELGEEWKSSHERRLGGAR